MVAETWILKVSNHVSSNIKHALLLEPSKKKDTKNQESKDRNTIGILSFEVANVMSKTVHLHKSLSDSEISKLKNDILNSEGVKSLVSSDDSYLLELALVEKLDDLNRVAAVVSRLGKKCTEPALQGFEHVYGDIVNGVIDVRELGFLVKDMEGMVKRIERYVNATSKLYKEMEVLNQLEQTGKKFQQNQHEESRRVFEQKLIWQRQDVRHLKGVSLWNQTFDKVVELLARTLCTIYGRISLVFGASGLRMGDFRLAGGLGCSPLKGETEQVSGPMQKGLGIVKEARTRNNGHHSGPVQRAAMVEKRGSNLTSQLDSRRVELAPLQADDFMFPCGIGPGRLFMECLSLSSSADKFDDDRSSQSSGCCSIGNNGLKGAYVNHTVRYPTQIGVRCGVDQRETSDVAINCAPHGPKSRLTAYAPPSTVGGSALALHYANVIIVIEKVLRYPHLVGNEARDNLYQMLPTSLRVSLKSSLKSYFKNLAIYDAPLAHDWKETLDGILGWLAPMAHNMIKWQSERNFEQHQIVTKTNVLLLQTLYFADMEKTEAAICKFLVGLNYICRYEQQQNALLDCASSFDFDDCVEWRVQC